MENTAEACSFLYQYGCMYVLSVNVCIVLCEGTVEALCPITLATLSLHFDLKSIISTV